MTRPTLFTHIAKRDTMVEMAANLFGAVASGKVVVPVNARFALADAPTRIARWRAAARRARRCWFPDTRRVP